MSVIYVLLTISIIVAVIFFIAFIVSVKNGQYDDSYTPSVRMLFEDELVTKKQENRLCEERGKLLSNNSEITDCRTSLSMANKKIQLKKQL